jgi:hypothetical protein
VFLLYVFSRHNADKADEFFEALFEGQGLTKEHPVWHVRSRLIENLSRDARYRPEFVCALVIKAWNAFIQDRRIGSLRIADGEEFPEIVGYPV